jgi:hybrid cluster-associated redox disulfide protein
MAKELINKKMTFSEVLEKAPESIEVLFTNGMHCIGCGMAGMESLEDGALAHGLDPDKIVEEINKKLKGKKETKIKKTKK